MIRITFDTALTLHKLLQKKTGGGDGLRDAGLLEAALNAPYQSFGNLDLYPGVEEKAARLGFSLISNHPFLDGNKRMGMLSMMTFLRLNGSEITPDIQDVTRVGFAVASGKMDYSALLMWIRENKA